MIHVEVQNIIENRHSVIEDLDRNNEEKVNEEKEEDYEDEKTALLEPEIRVKGDQPTDEREVFSEIQKRPRRRSSDSHF